MNVQPNFKEDVQHDNPEYLKMVRELPCCVCVEYGEVQMSPTTAHHPIHGRYSGAKRPDVTAIPLCDGHHQGTFDNSKFAIHQGKETWAEFYGLDTDYIAATQDKLGFGS